MRHDRATPLAPADDAVSGIWTRDRVFNAPRFYDVAFAWDIEPEVALLSRVLPDPPPDTPPARVLVPACGTGRYALAMARRGHEVSAVDISAAMVEHARRERAHPLVRYAVGDITEVIDAPDASFDAGFLMCNSFRYLLTEAGARRHLDEVRRTLKPGAAYVIDVGLGEGPEHVGGVADWTVTAQGYRAHARWTTLAATPPLGLDLVEISLTRLADGHTETVVEHQPQRLWTYADLHGLATAAGLEVAAVRTRSGALVADPTRPVRAHVELRRPS